MIRPRHWYAEEYTYLYPFLTPLPSTPTAGMEAHLGAQVSFQGTVVQKTATRVEDLRGSLLILRCWLSLSGS